MMVAITLWLPFTSRDANASPVCLRPRPITGVLSMVRTLQMAQCTGLLCALVLLITSQTLNETRAGEHEEVGLASFYFHGEKTASGEPFDSNALTGAHRTVPFGTMVRVTMLKTGKQVTVRINDRGPFVKGRIIDVSRNAAEVLGMVGAGLAGVKVEIMR